MSLSRGGAKGLELERTAGVLAVSGSGQGGRGNTLPLPPTNLNRNLEAGEASYLVD